MNMYSLSVSVFFNFFHTKHFYLNFLLSNPVTDQEQELPRSQHYDDLRPFSKQELSIDANIGNRRLQDQRSRSIDYTANGRLTASYNKECTDENDHEDVE